MASLIVFVFNHMMWGNKKHCMMRKNYYSKINTAVKRNVVYSSYTGDRKRIVVEVQNISNDLIPHSKSSFLVINIENNNKNTSIF